MNNEFLKRVHALEPNTLKFIALKSLENVCENAILIAWFIWFNHMIIGFASHAQTQSNDFLHHKKQSRLRCIITALLECKHKRVPGDRQCAIAHGSNSTHVKQTTLQIIAKPQSEPGRARLTAIASPVAVAAGQLRGPSPLLPEWGESRDEKSRDVFNSTYNLLWYDWDDKWFLPIQRLHRKLNSLEGISWFGIGRRVGRHTQSIKQPSLCEGTFRRFATEVGKGNN